VSYDLLKVLDIPLAEGRNFLRENPADASGFLLNETAAKSLNLDQPVGKEIVLDRDGDLQKGSIIGIVKDFHFQSLHLAVQPLIFTVRKANFNYALIKLNTSDFDATLKDITTTWKKFDNRFGFEFSFLSDTLNEQYAEEQKIANVLLVFSVVAILIACLGLLGIAALTFQNRTKEVSVRKVLGASIPQIVSELSKDFLILVIISAIIALPVSGILMFNWLHDFAFRVSLIENWWVFVMAGVLALIIAFVTISFQSIKAAMANPVKSLRSE